MAFEIEEVKDNVTKFVKDNKTLFIIGGVGLGAFMLLRPKQQTETIFVPAAPAPEDYPGGVGGGGGVDTSDFLTSRDLEDFTRGILDVIVDVNDSTRKEMELITKETLTSEIGRLTERYDRLEGNLSEMYDRERQYITEKKQLEKELAQAKSGPKISDSTMVVVNQGKEGNKVLESVASVEARQKERYDRALSRGDTKAAELVKWETENATGRKVDW